MNYLLVNGSPRRGNTWKLAELIKARILEAQPDAAFRELHLAQAALPFCLGCSNCFRLGPEHCPHRAVMESILAELNWADGVIVSLSTYNMAAPALYKNLEDHLCYLLHRPCFFTKKALVVTTTGGVGAAKAAKTAAGTLTGIGFNRAYRLAVPSHSWNCFAPTEKQSRKARAATARFAADVGSGILHPPGLLNLIPYNLFRGMCVWQTSAGPYPTADGPHWTDPVRARRCYDAAVPVRGYHRLFGSLFYGIGKVAGKRVTVSYRK